MSALPFVSTEMGEDECENGKMKFGMKAPEGTFKQNNLTFLLFKAVKIYIANHIIVFF